LVIQTFYDVIKTTVTPTVECIMGKGIPTDLESDACLNSNSTNSE